MLIHVVTLFPDMVQGALEYSILGRARAAGVLEARVHNLRDWAEGRHRKTDDTPYGGGAGMVMLPGPWFACLESLAPPPDARIVLLSPQGKTLTQAMARELSGASTLVLLCGHYEGFDERVRTGLATDEVSIGDYVLTGGELPALVIIDAVARLLPGTLGNEESAEGDTFSDGLLEYPQWTRPPEFRGERIPDVLLSGHHAEIARWRRKEQMRRTRQRRPDLWAAFVPATKSDRILWQQVSAENPSPVVGEHTQESKEDHASTDPRD